VFKPLNLSTTGDPFDLNRKHGQKNDRAASPLITQVLLRKKFVSLLLSLLSVVECPVASPTISRHAGSKTLLISADNNQRTKTTVGHANWISATRGSGKVNRRPQSNYRSIEPAPRTHEGEQKREHHRLGFRKQDTRRKSTNGTTSTRLLPVFTTDCTTANGLITKVVWEILTDRKLPPTHNRGQN
jgi:hypothetical protein